MSLSVDLGCLKFIDLFVLTSGDHNADSDGRNQPTIHFEHYGYTLIFRIPELAVDDFESGKGDWYRI